MRISAAATAATLAIAVPAFALPTPVSDEGAAVSGHSTSRDVAAETELYCLTLGIYFEGGSTFEPEMGLRHIARVITERAKADRPYWGGKTVCGVVFYSRGKVCQFSFACLPEARRTPRQNALWEQAEAIAKDALDGRNEVPDPLIRYYMNEELSALKNVCAFRKEFVPVVRAGRHEFFREATTAERAALAKTDPEACRRYAAQLKKAKLKAAKLKGKKNGKKSRTATAPARKKYSTASR